MCLLDAPYGILDVPPAAEELAISTDDKQGHKEGWSDAALRQYLEGLRVLIKELTTGSIAGISRQMLLCAGCSQNGLQKVQHRARPVPRSDRNGIVNEAT